MKGKERMQMVRQLAMAAPHTTRFTVSRPTQPVGGMGREGLKQERPGKS